MTEFYTVQYHSLVRKQLQHILGIYVMLVVRLCANCDKSENLTWNLSLSHMIHVIRWWASEYIAILKHDLATDGDASATPVKILLVTSTVFEFI